MQPPISRVQTNDPIGVTLGAMGRAAREAAQTWTVREWAARAAAKSKRNRDYREQLRKLYDAVLERWRYVQEPGEWTTGTGDAVAKYTLGAQYNCKDPLRCVVDRIPPAKYSRGWGDCDDVSALVAAGALALGMTPVFRAVLQSRGGHVSTLVRTPDGQEISVDPVGHPDHPFGWRFNPPGSRVVLFNMHGQAIGTERQPTHMYALPNMPMMRTATTNLGAVPDFSLGRLSGTYMRGPRAHAYASDGHVVLLRPGAHTGARVLAMPEGIARVFRQGGGYLGALATDQYGDSYEYVPHMDAWAPAGYLVEGVDCPMRAGLGYVPDTEPIYVGDLAGRTSRRRRRAARRRRRRARQARAAARRVRRRKKIARVFKKITAPLARLGRRISARALGNPAVQAAIGAALRPLGVPPQVTKRLLSAASRSIRKGKGSRFLSLIFKRKWREAARMAKAAVRDLGQGLSRDAAQALEKAGAQFGSLMESGQEYAVAYPSGHTYRTAPVLQMAGFRLGAEDIPEAVEPHEEFEPEPDEEDKPDVDEGDIVTPPPGAPDADAGPRQSLGISKEPTPGYYYRIGTGTGLRGKGLLSTAGAAYGLKSGTWARLRAAQRINKHPLNKKLRIKKTKANSWTRKNFGKTIITFRPKFSRDPERAHLGKRGGSFGVIYIPLGPDDPGPSGPVIPEDAAPVEPPMPPPAPVPPQPQKPTCPPGTQPVMVDGQWICRPCPPGTKLVVHVDPETEQSTYTCVALEPEPVVPPPAPIEPPPPPEPEDMEPEDEIPPEDVEPDDDDDIVFPDLIPPPDVPEYIPAPKPPRPPAPEDLYRECGPGTKAYVVPEGVAAPKGPQVERVYLDKYGRTIVCLRTDVPAPQPTPPAPAPVPPAPAPYVPPAPQPMPPQPKPPGAGLAAWVPMVVLALLSGES